MSEHRGMNAMAAGAIAALVGGAIWSGANCWFDPDATLRRFIGLTLLSAMLGLFVVGLAAPLVARWTIRDEPVRWGNAALTGMLAPTIPGIIFLIVAVPRALMLDEPMPVMGWLIGIPMLAVAGAVAGLAFRGLYGERDLRR